ncbi:MAG: cysteine--tRNA ligase [Planctomycetaceae bacterium]|nr:cysteine--tRNA ligase [Planctomycetaceae bacterium]
MATVANAASGKGTAEPATNIRVYNTLTKVKEPFTTVQPGKVGMYLCGPTVYKEAHIGHMVGPVIFDTIKRYLTYSGYEVTWVVNITDVDDKLIAQSHERGISMFQVATEMTADYLANLQSLGVTQIDHLPRATDNMDEIIRFIEELIAKDIAYASNGDVFFDVMRDPQYGQLSNRSPDSQQGEGGEAASRKRNPGDFALWKSAKPGEPAWDSPWGQGRPGWHIECSAMSRRILGKTFDIHGGGLDLVFPHHENELAQSRCCHGQPMVKYWLHNGLMKAASQAGKVGGKSDRENAEPEQADVSSKISRSKGGGGLAALIEKQTGERIRFFLLRSHYRSTIVFDDEGLAEAGTSLESFYRLFTRYQRISGKSFYEIPYCTKRSSFVAPTNATGAAAELIKEAVTRRTVFLEKMDDDFNTGGAVSDLFELARAINRFIDASNLEDATKRTEENLKAVQDSLGILRELASLLGVFVKPPKKSAGGDQAKVVDGLMQLMLAVRAEARKTKNFAMADMIRNGLTELKITVQDLKDGTTWELAE